MRTVFAIYVLKALFLLVSSAAFSGCTVIVSSAANGLADNLSVAILNQDDPELVRAGAPSYLLLLDSFVESSPDNADTLAAAATLYATYGAVFANDEVRASRLTTRARRYALKAMCESYAPACGWPDATYDEFVATLSGIRPRKAEFLYTYGFASLAYLRAHSSDVNSIAELPQIEALLSHYLDISGDAVNSSAYTYMGILLTLRPPAAGGEPERARGYFEKAIALTGGKDLGAKVEFARSYAKKLYEREMHDQLLNEVMAADPYQDGYTLGNVLAQEEAAALLAEADDYF
ncbi:MAG: TRAP transporter TatT component family protein [Gammaproteobacteria bacterium]|nr:TRAP transporter TatT component family protein [Gammaproteobacteria bacterium]MDH3364012.1 TRAP transporter TatT component family protein [Gammaproteobacteria bacterium]MDH3482400.1 TRAP transporter TatT component family protein [Gammaproteobacteria bacterium]